MGGALTSDATDMVPKKSIAEKARDREVLEFGEFTFHPRSGQLSVMNQIPVELTKIQRSVLTRIIEGNISGINPISESLFVTMREAGSKARLLKVVHQAVHRLKKQLDDLSAGGDRHITVADGVYGLSVEKQGKCLKAISSWGRKRQ